MRSLKIIAPTIFLFFVIYLPGPQLDIEKHTKDFPVIPTNLSSMETMVSEMENDPRIRAGNEAEIIWANDTLHQQTEYALIYLHGFSSSKVEGDPLHRDFAKYFGCNAYLSRLASHGLSVPEPLLDMQPSYLYDTAKKALAIAEQLGKKVIVMSTSTGGTLSLMLAAEFPEKVHSLILYSPNIRINNPAAFILNNPWGLQIAQAIHHGKYYIKDDAPDSEKCKYWYCKYRLEGLVYLEEILESNMNKATYEQVKVPVFMGYYYKDRDNQDDVVKVSAMLEMYDQLGTPNHLKRKQSFPSAGKHEIASSITSGAINELRIATFEFAEEVLGIRKIKEEN